MKKSQRRHQIVRCSRNTNIFRAGMVMLTTGKDIKQEKKMRDADESKHIDNVILVGIPLRKLFWLVHKSWMISIWFARRYRPHDKLHVVQGIL